MKRLLLILLLLPVMAWGATATLTLKSNLADVAVELSGTSASGGGEIARIGDVQTHTATASGDTSVTVPAGADFMVIAVGGYSGAANFFQSTTFSIGGDATTLHNRADADGGEQQAALYGRLSPATGSQTLAWSFSSTPEYSMIIYYAFYENVSGVRSAGGSHNASGNSSTGTLTALEGDLVVATANRFPTGTMTWTNATAIRTDTYDDTYAYAEGSPTGNVNVSISGTADLSAISGMVLQP